jgi:hypothetical protein
MAEMSRYMGVFVTVGVTVAVAVWVGLAVEVALVVSVGLVVAVGDAVEVGVMVQVGVMEGVMVPVWVGDAQAAAPPASSFTVAMPAFAKSLKLLRVSEPGRGCRESMVPLAMFGAGAVPWKQKDPLMPTRLMVLRDPSRRSMARPVLPKAAKLVTSAGWLPAP